MLTSRQCLGRGQRQLVFRAGQVTIPGMRCRTDSREMAVLISHASLSRLPGRTHLVRTIDQAPSAGVIRRATSLPSRWITTGTSRPGLTSAAAW